MLKGKTIIELTDVNTGQKDIIEEENMVTNAITNIFDVPGTMIGEDAFVGDKNNGSLIKSLLGGLLLFDIPIEENANQLYAPAEANLIGCAVYDKANTSSSKIRGNYNSIESEFNKKQKYMKFVYDFGTSQANGTISSIALTHAFGGYSSYGCKEGFTTDVGLHYYPYMYRNLQFVNRYHTEGNTADKTFYKYNAGFYTGMTVGESEHLFLFDIDNDVAYYFMVRNTNSISIIKRKMYLSSMSVFDIPYRRKDKIEEITIDNIPQSVFLKRMAYNFDISDNCLYIFTSNHESYMAPSTGTFIITKVHFGDWSVQQYVMTNTSGVNICTRGLGESTSASTDNPMFAFANEGHVYLRSYDSPYDVYKFKIGDSADVVKINRNGFSIGADFCPILAVNGRIYYQDLGGTKNSSKVYIVNSATNELLKIENNRVFVFNDNKYDSKAPTYTPVLNHEMMFFYSNGSTNGETPYESFFILANYLGTINNLAQPVTKTADKTMKVTYTIQEE